LLDEHGADGVRYWATSAGPGADTIFDPANPAQMKVGRRLATKILNASKFALMQSEPQGAVHVPVDRGMLVDLAALVRKVTEKLESYDYASALDVTEKSFWSFCDDYIELVKSRRYGDRGSELAGSANTALLTSLSVYLRLFAPYLPFVTEEVWSWWQPGSIHRAAWPTPDELTVDRTAEHDERAFKDAQSLLGLIRREKSLQGLKNKSRVHVRIDADEQAVTIARSLEDDLRPTVSAVSFEYQTIQDADLRVSVRLAEEGEAA